MEEYTLIELSHCPRCNSKGYERLATHSYCVLCEYSPTLADPDQEAEIPLWATEALTTESGFSCVPLGRLKAEFAA